MQWKFSRISGSYRVQIDNNVRSNDEIEQWAAFVIGIIGGIMYVIVAKILHKLQIDDPVDAIPIHAGCGLAGAMCPGWFDRRRGIFYGDRAYQWGV